MKFESLCQNLSKKKIRPPPSGRGDDEELLYVTVTDIHPIARGAREVDGGMCNRGKIGFSVPGLCELFVDPPLPDVPKGSASVYLPSLN